MSNERYLRIRQCVLLMTIGLQMPQVTEAQQTLLLDKNIIIEGNATDMPERHIDNIDNGVITTYAFHSVLKQENSSDPNTCYLKILGFGLSSEKSTPTVPMRRDSYAIPDNSICRVSVVDSNYVEIPIALAPAIEPHIITSIKKEDSKVSTIKPYEGFYPKAVTSTSLSKYGKNSIINVQLCPIQYDYSNKIARIFKKITYKIVFEKQGNDKQKQIVNKNRLYDTYLSNTCLNVTPNNSERSAGSLTSERKDYLIISCSKYRETAFKFARWKGMLGFSTHIELRDSGQWTSTAIKNVIDDYACDYEGLSYVLFIGDHQDVPAGTTSTQGVVSDFYYLNSTNNISPIGIGRLPVSTQEEARIVTDKIIAYEKTPVQDPNFYSKVLDCAYFQDRHAPYDSIPHTEYAQRRFAQTAEDIRNHLLLQGKNVERVYYCHSNSNPKYWNNGIYSWGEEIPIELQKPNFMWNGNAGNIISAINTGTFCVIHNDHGGPDTWRDPWFHKVSIDDLNNGNKTPIVFSMNCETGKFNDSICFAEKFLRKEHGGCVAIYAFSGEGYSGYNDALILGMMDAIWPTPSLIPSFPNKVSHATPTPTPVYTLSQIMKQGLKRMDETWYGNTYLRTKIYERFHCFGDPSMKIYTEVPTSFSNASVVRQDGNIYVRTGGMESVISFYNTETGVVQSYIDTVAVFSGNIEPINVCISAHNKIPFIDESSVTFLQNQSLEGTLTKENDIIRVGSHVTSTEPEGPVIIKTGKTTLRAKTTELNGVTEVKLGAELEIVPQ